MLFWSMALLSLVLLPTNVRAGSEITHSHSILQLLLDAQDGQISHHHSYHFTFGQRGDWFDPGISTDGDDAEASTEVGDHQNSIPVPGGMQLVLLVGLALWLARSPSHPICTATQRLFGAFARVPAPPPRSVIG